MLLHTTNHNQSIDENNESILWKLFHSNENIECNCMQFKLNQIKFKFN
jgi:hypothetical protein